MHPAGLMVETERVATELRDYWAERPGDGVVRRGRLAIDVTHAQGRSEMLALTLLYAAQVTDRAVEATFFTLQSEGLLERERLRAAPPDDVRLVEEILRSVYKARISKVAKAEALFTNEQRLEREWGGDLQRIYEALRSDPPALLGALQGFDQIHRRAVWLCREMAAAGVWTDLAPEITAYIDPAVRRPLERLGLLNLPPTSTWKEIRSACADVVNRLFEGDAVALARHGAERCGKEDRHVCQSSCTVRYACRWWLEGA